MEWVFVKVGSKVQHFKLSKVTSQAVLILFVSLTLKKVEEVAGEKICL